MRIFYRKSLSVLVAIIICLATVFSIKLDSNAVTADYDEEAKKFVFEFKPYGDINSQYAVVYKKDINMRLKETHSFSIQCSLYDVEAKRFLKGEDKLVAGRKYKYTAKITKTQYHTASYSMKDCSISIVNVFDPDDKTFYSDSKVQKYDDYIECECMLTIRKKPQLETEPIYVDFTSCVDYGFNFDELYELNDYLDAAVSAGDVKEKPLIDEQLNKVGELYDLDKDGNYDIGHKKFEPNNQRTYRVMETSNLKGEYTVKCPQKKIDECETYLEKYHKAVVFRFAKEEDGEKTDDKTDGDESKDSSVDKKDSSTDKSDTSSGKTDTSKSESGDIHNSPKYKNEWVDGKWYDEFGNCIYDGILSWKQNETGWWVEDSKGWYPQSQWVKIDGKWYYFCADGYMDYSEYRDGCWLGADGAWDEAYSGGHWMSDRAGWWYEDNSGWYPQSQWVWIDGSCYYFEANGYMAVNKNVDGCWVGSDGAWVK